MERDIAEKMAQGKMNVSKENIDWFNTVYSICLGI